MKVICINNSPYSDCTVPIPYLEKVTVMEESDFDGEKYYHILEYPDCKCGLANMWYNAKDFIPIQEEPELVEELQKEMA